MLVKLWKYILECYVLYGNYVSFLTVLTGTTAHIGDIRIFHAYSMQPKNINNARDFKKFKKFNMTDITKAFIRYMNYFWITSIVPDQQLLDFRGERIYGGINIIHLFTLFGNCIIIYRLPESTDTLICFVWYGKVYISKINLYIEHILEEIGDDGRSVKAEILFDEFSFYPPARI